MKNKVFIFMGVLLTALSGCGGGVENSVVSYSIRSEAPVTIEWETKGHETPETNVQGECFIGPGEPECLILLSHTKGQPRTLEVRYLATSDDGYYDFGGLSADPGSLSGYSNANSETCRVSGPYPCGFLIQHTDSSGRFVSVTWGFRTNQGIDGVQRLNLLWD